MPESVSSTEKFSFDVEFQKKILKLMIEDPNVLLRIRKFCKKEYFANEYLEWVYTKIVEYYDQYQKIITRDVFTTELFEIYKRDGRNPIEYVTVIEDILKKEITEKEFILDKLKEWLSIVIFVKGSQYAADLFNNGNVKKSFEVAETCIKEAKSISFETPERTFFFDDLQERIFKRNAILDKEDYKFLTGILSLDDITNGGLSRGELGIVAADAKKGKSIFLLNVGAAAVRFGFKVLHFSLEGKDLQVDNRYEAKFLNQLYRDVVNNNINPGLYGDYCRFSKSLVICNMNKAFDYNINHLEEEIQNLKAYDFVPDLILVDYGDLLKPRTKGHDTKYTSQEEVFQDLKILGTKHNAGVWSATQCHRIDRKVSNPDEDPNFLYTRHTLADSYGKVRVADLLITLNATRQEMENSRMRIYVDAYRDNICGKILNITTDYSRMQMYLVSQEELNNYKKWEN